MNIPRKMKPPLLPARDLLAEKYRKKEARVTKAK